MARYTHSFALSLLLITLCLSLTGCWSKDPLSGTGELDGLSGAEGIGATQDSQSDAAQAATSFSLPYWAGETMDPFSCSDGIQTTLTGLLYEGLFELNPSFEPQAALCAEYSSADDYTRWTFTLREDVQFSNGNPLRAEDVVYSLQRAKQTARYSARFSDVLSIEASGRQIRIALSASNNRFPALLDIPIIAKASSDALHPAGTGPYFYQESDGGAALQANAHWWKEEALPLKTIPLCAISYADELTYQFSSRSVQMLVTDYTGSAPVSYKGDLLSTEMPTTCMQYLGFNCVSGPFTDSRLRQAVSSGIHRSSIAQAYFSGHAVPAQFPVSPASAWYPSDLDTPYSAEQYAAALTEAGYADGQRTNVELLVCDGNAFRLAAAKAIAAALSVGDFNVTLKTLPYEAYLLALQSGNFDFYYGEVRMTPDFNCSTLVKTGGSLNYGGFSDSALDEQIETAFSAAVVPKGTNQAMLSAIRAAAPIAVICFKSQSVVLQGGVVDAITPSYTNPFYQFSNWEIHIKGEHTNG